MWRCFLGGRRLVRVVASHLRRGAGNPVLLHRNAQLVTDDRPTVETLRLIHHFLIRPVNGACCGCQSAMCSNFALKPAAFSRKFWSDCDNVGFGAAVRFSELARGLEGDGVTSPPCGLVGIGE